MGGSNVKGQLNSEATVTSMAKTEKKTEVHPEAMQLVNKLLLNELSELDLRYKHIVVGSEFALVSNALKLNTSLTSQSSI